MGSRRTGGCRLSSSQHRQRTSALTCRLLRARCPSSVVDHQSAISAIGPCPVHPSIDPSAAAFHQGLRRFLSRWVKQRPSGGGRGGVDERVSFLVARVFYGGTASQVSRKVTLTPRFVPACRSAAVGLFRYGTLRAMRSGTNESHGAHSPTHAESRCGVTVTWPFIPGSGQVLC